MRRGRSHDGTVVCRICLGVVAVLAAAWLGLSLRNDQITINGLKNSIYAAATPSPGPAKDRLLESTLRDLRRAQLLNPDRTPAIYESLVQSGTDREAAAQRLAKLTRSYPEDAFAWAAILRVLPPSDPRAAEARSHLRSLIPQRPR